MLGDYKQKVVLSDKILFALLLFLLLILFVWLLQIINQDKQITLNDKVKYNLVLNAAEHEEKLQKLFGTKRDDVVVFYNAPDTQNCAEVLSLNRKLPKNNELTDYEFALQKLFEGPTKSERNKGYTSLFSQNTKNILKKVFVKKGIAYIDLVDIRYIIPNANSSCGQASFLAQIDHTILQFPEVNRFILAINGSPKTIYNWLQIGCNEENNNCDVKPWREK